MRILVTGGAGFIGSHVVDACLDAGHQVLVVDDLSTGLRQNVSEQAAFFEGDMRSDQARDAIVDFAPEVVSHHAAQADVRKSVDDPAFDAEVNVLGTLKVLKAAHDGGALQHVVFISSGGAIYGEGVPLPATEDAEAAPLSPYGAAKLCGEVYVQQFGRLHHIPCGILRYANVYGPRQRTDGEAGVVAIFAAALSTDRPITVFGDGAQTRDFVFVKDVAQANLLALSQKLTGVFNVGTGIETSVTELATAIANACEVADDPQFAPARPGELARSAVDARKLKSAAPDWTRTDLKAGLADTVRWVRTTL